MNKRNTQEDQPMQQEMLGELKEIKGLLVLLLKKAGATQTELAKALSISQGTVSTQFKFGDVKPFETQVLPSDGEES